MFPPNNNDNNNKQQRGTVYLPYSVNWGISFWSAEGLLEFAWPAVEVVRLQYTLQTSRLLWALLDAS